MSERRYSDEEVAAIFQSAAEQQQTALASGAGGGARTPLASAQGMTLAQLQDIGREVGIPAELVARAAGSLDRHGRASVRRFLGLPLGVGRTVALERRLSDEEWERLVVDLRQTFDARGSIKNEGTFRQWTNGNLQALLEPTSTGHQLRLKTMKGDAYALMTGGLAVGAFGAISALFAALGEGSGGGVGMTAVMALGGLVAFALGALRLPGWAKERQKQMEEIAARLTETTR